MSLVKNISSDCLFDYLLLVSLAYEQHRMITVYANESFCSYDSEEVNIDRRSTKIIGSDDVFRPTIVAALWCIQFFGFTQMYLPLFLFFCRQKNLCIDSWTDYSLATSMMKLTSLSSTTSAMSFPFSFVALVAYPTTPDSVICLNI